MPKGIGDTQWVAAELRRAIRGGELLPGEQVRQEMWASKLMVSKMPVREALRLLVAEQVVQHYHNRGYFVTKLDASEMLQIYRMRMLLEPEVLRSIRAPSSRTIASMRTMTEETVSLLRERRIVEAFEIDREVYFAIFELSPLRYVVAEVERLWSMADAYRTASMQVELERDPLALEFRLRHLGVVDAIARSDHEELVRIVIEERTGVLSRLAGRLSAEQASLLGYSADGTGSRQRSRRVLGGRR